MNESEQIKTVAHVRFHPLTCLKKIIT